MARHGFNFRQSDVYVTDGTGEVSEIGVGYTAGRGYGWSTTSGLNPRNRNASYDRRIAGCNKTDTASIYWRYDLPEGPGRYRIWAGVYDLSFPGDSMWDLQDGTTTFVSLVGAVTATHGRDATDAALTPVEFASANGGDYVERAFTSDHFRLTISASLPGGQSSIISHLAFEPLVPLRLTQPTLAIGASTWSGTVGTSNNQSNGTITTEWELRDDADDSVIQSGTGSSPAGSNPPAGTYYLWCRDSNDGGYDAAEDGESSREVLVASELTGAEVNIAGTQITVTGSDTLVNSTGFTITADTAVTLTYISGSGSASLVFSLSRTIDKDETLALNYAPGDVTIGGSPLSSATGFAVSNLSTQDLTAPTVLTRTITASSLTIVFSEAVTNHTGFTVSSDSGLALGISYSSGDGTDTHVFSTDRDVGDFEVVTLTYAAGDVVDAAANALAGFTDAAITNSSVVTVIWGTPFVDISGDLIVLNALTTGGAADFDLATGATGSLTVNLGDGDFTVGPEYVSAGPTRADDLVVVVIPEQNRKSDATSCTLSASAGWVQTDGAVNLPALSFTLPSGDVLKETIPATTPRLLDEFQFNLGGTIGYYGANWLFANVVRHMDYSWRVGTIGGTSVSATTSLGLPAVSGTSVTFIQTAEYGNVPDDDYYIMWEGDASIEFSEASGFTTEISDTTSGGKRWKKFGWTTTARSAMHLSCSGNCSSITNLVVCRARDWDDTAKDLNCTLTPESIERFKNFTTMRTMDNTFTNSSSSPDITHITSADLLSVMGKSATTTAAITNIEDYTLTAGYYTDGDFYGKGSNYASGTIAAGTVLKITHDGTGTFHTGDLVSITGVTGTLDSVSINDVWRISSYPCFVPTGATTYFYVHAHTLTATNEYSLGTTGTATVSRKYGISPELMAEIANELRTAGGRLNELWICVGHHATAARCGEFASRLFAALDTGIDVVLEWSNEWTFNGGTVFAAQYYYARCMANMGITGWDDHFDVGAALLTQAYNEYASVFGASRVHPVACGQSSDVTTVTNLLDSAQMTCPVDRAGVTNYLGDLSLGLDDEINDSLTSSALAYLSALSVRNGTYISPAAEITGRGLKYVGYEGGSHATTGTSWPIAYTSGWTNAAANRWTRSEYRHIEDVAVSGDAADFTAVADAATCEATADSFFWDSVGEVLHVNFDGVDANTVTTNALRFDRKGVALRYMNFHPRFAKVFNYWIETCDGISMVPSQFVGLYPPPGLRTDFETYMWGIYNWFDMAAGDGDANLTHIANVYSETITDKEFFGLVESPRAWEINRWTDPANFASGGGGSGIDMALARSLARQLVSALGRGLSG